MAIITNNNPIIFGTNNADTIHADFDGANIYGYGGDDIYFINAFYNYAGIVNGGSGNADIPKDIIHEEVGGGVDTVHVDLFATHDGTASGFYGSYSYTLDANVENLIANLSGFGYGFSLNGNDSANNITVNANTSSDYAYISGYGGNDSLTGSLGEDHLDGGFGNDTLIGGLGNDSLDGGLGNDSMVGGAGDDFYIVDSTLDKVIEGVGAGIDIVNSLVNFTLGANVEKLYLNGSATTGTGNALDNYISGNGNNDVLSGVAGNDTLYGSFGNDKLDGGVGDDNLDGGDGNDTLLGGAGNDTFEGKAGNDKMDGGAGNDIYIDVDTGDSVTDSGGGIDLLQTSVSLLGDLGTGIDNLTLYGSDNISGRGNALNNIIIGNDGINSLSGLAGNDSLSGGLGADILTGGDGNDTLDGGTGADLMNGGNGNDSYIVDEANDTAVEASALAVGGTDTVFSSVDFLLGANIENLILTGAGSINGTGNNIANIITGNGGDNVLTGGDGNDTYIVDNAGDKVIELVGAAAGIDTIKSSVTFDLRDSDQDTNKYGANDNVEKLILTGIDDLVGYGNALANTITGNDGDNSLLGGDGNDILIGGAGNDGLRGDAGNDSMTGGAGDDTYYVDVAGDIVNETVAGSSGIDKVIVNSTTIVTYTLGTNVENLTLQSSNTINGTGNTLNNYIIGSNGNNSLNGGAAGNDTLDGGGNGEADTMNGGSGNDTYYVDNIGDVIADSTGIDNVYSAVTFTLGATLENLTLTGSSSINGTGNALANILIGNSGDNVLTGLGGNDTYIVNNAGDVVDEIFGSGIDLVKSSVDFSLNTSFAAQIENLTLIGGGDINGEGNDLANILTGNSGSNTLTGMGGNDTYIIDSLLDSVVEIAGTGTGTDTVKSSVTYTLVPNVENLTLTGTGSIDGIGNALSNLIIGNASGNKLDGGGTNEIDTMIGGLGADRYYVDNILDVVTETGGETFNAVYSSVNWTLAPKFFEKLQLEGIGDINGTGNTQNNRIYGNSGINVLKGMDGNDDLEGGGGNDTLEGGNGNDSLYGGVDNDSLTGGAGNDVLDGESGADDMAGGAGNDRYFVDNAGDVITEGANAGTDTVYSTITFNLTDPTNANLENLTLTGSDPINGTGNNFANIIAGNSGANVLTGLGGNDTYIVGAGDAVFEAVGEGTDLVISSVNFDLNNTDGIYGSNVENLTLTGSANIYGYGNDMANVIIGNDGDNSLNGGDGNDKLDGGLGDDDLFGDAGNDTMTGGLGDDDLHGGDGNDSMTGGAGNDTYYVDVAGDKVIEAAGGGNDTVYSSITFSLAALTNVENLYLDSSGNINGTGNTLNNVVYGGDGNNVLKGGAGNDTLNGGNAGTDTLSGEAGNDVFIFVSGSASDTTVTDFSSGADSIGLGSFAGLTFDGAGGSLNAGQFHLGTEADDVDHHVIFDAVTKNLYYDSDGDGGTGQVLIAHFSNLGVSVAATDIFESS